MYNISIYLTVQGMGRLRLLDGFRVQRLLRALHDPDPKTRIDAVDALGELGDDRAVEPLILAMQQKDNSGIIQARIIVALGKLQDRRSTEILLRVLYDKVEIVPFSEMARIKAIESLGLIGDERAIRPLFVLLKRMGDREGTYEGNLFSRIRETLARIGSVHPLPFREFMKDQDDYFRSEAARVLRSTPDPANVPVLIEALEDVNYVVRINAAETLGLIRDPQATESLHRSLKDVNRDVRSAARQALDRIEGRESSIPVSKRSFLKK
ncbi:MAG: HEAT repeat domain-containing protein [Methanomicrobiales archaeon]|nr:HEAT repeat domain-containing protein [Methanomicrobiales archaeon]